MERCSGCKPTKRETCTASRGARSMLSSKSCPGESATSRPPGAAMQGGGGRSGLLPCQKTGNCAHSGCPLGGRCRCETSVLDAVAVAATQHTSTSNSGKSKKACCGRFIATEAFLWIRTGNLTRSICRLPMGFVVLMYGVDNSSVDPFRNFVASVRCRLHCHGSRKPELSP